MVRNGGNAIRLGEKIAASAAFKTLFSDGMALVEETASYLDGEGRDDAKSLPRNAALAYASESMRLTTRLMQIASWLLLQRAVNEGEMTQAEVSSDKRRTRIAWQQTPTNDAGAIPLPCQLIALIDASMRLQARIVHLDALISDPMPSGATFAQRPVEAQLSRLRDAFC
jgi:regulator of CtrA degradation